MMSPAKKTTAPGLRLEVDARAFTAQLATAVRACATRTAVEILRGVRLDASDGSLLASATNLEWSLSLDFQDNGFCEIDASEGELRMRYVVTTEQLPISLATLKQDAERLGIEWDNASGGPTVYVEGDGETDRSDRPDLRRLANEQAVVLGWKQCYSREVVQT